MITVDDVITDFNGVYDWIVTEEFIQHRDTFAKQLSGTGTIRRADATVAEFVFAEHIPSFKLTSASEWQNDLLCEIYKYLDAKQYAKAGVKVAPAPIQNVKEGKINYFPVWKYFANNRYPGPLIVGQHIELTMLGLVPAELAVENLQDVKNPKGEIEKRFMFPEELNV